MEILPSLIMRAAMKGWLLLEGTTPRTGGPYGVNHELYEKRNTEGKVVIVLVHLKVLNQVGIGTLGRNQPTTSL